MTPREKTVVRAIAKALRGGGSADMNALACSYEMPTAYDYFASTRLRAIIFLMALTEDDPPLKEKKNVDSHQTEPKSDAH